MKNTHTLKLSVIIPVFNEGSNVNRCYQAVTDSLEGKVRSYEIIFVDDGSSDDTFARLSKLASADRSVKVLKFATNGGSHIAIRAGMSYSSGDAVCFIAADMQEPPTLILKMLNKLKEPYHIVWAVRESRGDSLITRLFAKIFYFLARTIVSKNIPPMGASMFLVNRTVIQALEHYRERNLTLEGLFATMGFQSTHIYYHRANRTHGTSKWTISKRLKLAIDFFVAYSYVPIRLVSFSGIILFVGGVIWTSYIMARHVLIGDLSPGWPALLSVLLVGFGITNIGLGIIAEYLWRTLDEARGRPNYIIEHSINI